MSNSPSKKCKLCKKASGGTCHIHLKKSSSPSSPVEIWKFEDIEAFCDNWLEQEDPEDKEGILAFFEYAARKGVLDSDEKNISNLCKIFIERKKLKKRQKSKKRDAAHTKLKHATLREIDVSQYKPRDLEAEKMDILIRERERQDEARKTWDKITQKAYVEYFLKKNQMNVWNNYMDEMLRLLDEEILKPSNEYKQRWENVLRKY